ncbi:MAG: hypothetical protein SAK29_08530 [Scytonema sp. PMC 1069.18]|nr:hypothetical protein [Scytonema sp. PMC 1069.18]MEC4883373.1 hypothetical protein [Scytonema sp. PMC 1070.18]
MQNTKLIASFITSIVLSSSFSTIYGKIVLAQRPQRPVPLLNAKCVNSGLGSARSENLDVSIGRAVYTSQFYLGPGYRSASITCNINPNNRPQPLFETLNLGFGMLDSSNSPSVEVRVFVDGNQVEARTIGPGQPNSLALNVSNVNNVAIETVCSSPTQYCDRVYFFNAGLEKPSLSQQPKK